MRKLPAAAVLQHWDNTPPTLRAHKHVSRLCPSCEKRPLILERMSGPSRGEGSGTRTHDTLIKS